MAVLYINSVMNSIGNSKIFTIIIAFVVGLGLGWVLFGRYDILNQNKKPTSVQEKQVVLDLSSALPLRKSVILVDDQPAGNKVVITFLNLEKESWVAINEDKGGKPGNILGAQKFPAGKTEKGEVELLRNTVPGKIYYAIVRSDDGVKGQTCRFWTLKAIL